MKVIIAGSRGITDRDAVIQRIDRLREHLKKTFGKDITEIVSGGARGVDAIGEYYGEQNNIPVTVMHADWDRYGRGAGHVRNNEMAKYADAAIVIHTGTPGSRNMVQTAKRYGLQVAECWLPTTQE